MQNAWEREVDMEHSPYETSKSRKGAAFEMWGVKEVATAVLFSALMIVVMFVVGSVTMLGVDFSMLFMAATYVLVVAPLYMLMVMRVNRFGVTAFYACVMALVYLMFGNLWYMLPFYLVGGLAIDALFLRTAAQRAKPNRIVAAWATFSALYSLSSIIPILVNLQGYLQELAEVRMMGEEYVNAYLKYYGNAEWIVFIVALTAFAGFLGALVGKRLMRKHFLKAGVI